MVSLIPRLAEAAHDAQRKRRAFLAQSGKQRDRDREFLFLAYRLSADAACMVVGSRLTGFECNRRNAHGRISHTYPSPRKPTDIGRKSSALSGVAFCTRALRSQQIWLVHHQASRVHAYRLCVASEDIACIGCGRSSGSLDDSLAEWAPRTHDIPDVQAGLLVDAQVAYQDRPGFEPRSCRESLQALRCPFPRDHPSPMALLIVQ